MVGDLKPGPRAKQQFLAIDLVGAQATYSRSCTVKTGEFLVVKVPLSPDATEDYRSLKKWERRFVEQNITPAEYAASRINEHLK